jgi:hypothetical protein
MVEILFRGLQMPHSVAEESFFANTLETERRVEPFGTRIVEIDDQPDPLVTFREGPIAHRRKQLRPHAQPPKLR